MACGSRSACVQFALGSREKWTSSYFAGANWDPCFAAHSAAFRWRPLRVLQLCYAVRPVARIDVSSMYPTPSVSCVLYASIKSVL